VVQCGIYALVNPVTLLKRFWSFSSFTDVNLLGLGMHFFYMSSIIMLRLTEVVLVSLDSGELIDILESCMLFHLSVHITMSSDPADTTW